MEDSLSVKSNESVATSDEFDFVCDKPGSSKTPTLNVANGDLDGLKQKLTEVLQEQESTAATTTTTTMDKRNEVDAIGREDTKEVGQSKFYDCVEEGTDVLELSRSKSSPGGAEKQDEMKPETSEESEEEVSDVDQECTKFSGVTYLGAATINAPKSEVEIQRNMGMLNEQITEQGIKVAVSVPSSSQGVVVLYEASTQAVMARYEIHRILFYARGSADGPESACFAFTWSHGDTQESAIFQCHVFRCDIPEAVSHVSGCFAKAFQRVPRSMSSSVASAGDMSSSIVTIPSECQRTLMYVFEVSLEIKEEDGRGGYSAVVKDRGGFRLRVNTAKQLALTVRQVSDNGPQLCIERCFGVLVAPGRHVKHSDMQLLEMSEDRAGSSQDQKEHQQKDQKEHQQKDQQQQQQQQQYHICARWDPTEPAFETLNTETARDQRTYVTVAVDLVVRGISEPVRFVVETPARVYGQGERFWYFSQRRSLVQQFFLNLKEVVSGELGDVHYEVLGMETSGELDRNRLNLTLSSTLSSLIRSPSVNSVEALAVPHSPNSNEECLSDGDEPLLSGTGRVSKDCSVDVLESWAEVLGPWKKTRQRPRQLAALVRQGVPEALRGEVWQRLAGTDSGVDPLMDTYRILITKDCSCENVIQRDIARTFPAHDFFKEAGGLGQDSLYRVSKAYAVYDSEVGYCQGLSFLAAALLLHMPEEQTFCILVRLMYDYRLRDLYKDGFENLYLRLYQLNRLMEEQLTALWQHFANHRIETHMFASQWFLTLFTARFPLYFVFHILDVFLLQGIDTLFQVAMALLTVCRRDLVQLDFEGILKYFRVTLPRRCRSEETARRIMKLACSIKVKKISKYEQEFTALKEAQDSVDGYTDEVEQLRAAVARHEDERRLARDEIAQLKEMLKREADRADADRRRSGAVVADYKRICRRLDDQLVAANRRADRLRSTATAAVRECASCSEAVASALAEVDAEESGGVADGEEKQRRLADTPPPPPPPGDDGAAAASGDAPADRIRELELELAQTKLAHVEAECRNQDLAHQLSATVSELQAKNSWPPWLSKTLSSIKEVANKKDLPPPFFSLPNSHSSTGPSFVSHVNPRRDSAPSLKDAPASSATVRTHN